MLKRIISVVIFLSLNLKDIGWQLVPFVSASKEVYSDCGKTHFCFGVSSDLQNKKCINRKNCDVITSVLIDEASKMAKVGIQGKLSGSEGWIGLGLSDDVRMGSDLCMICVKLADGRRTSSFFSWNPEGEPFSVIIDQNDITNNAVLTLKKHSVTNTDFYCEFETSSEIKYKDQLFDLAKTKFHILLARGDGDVTATSISNHHPQNRWALGDKESLLTAKSFHKSSDDDYTLAKVHGILMVIAFMLFMSVGAFVARFYKETLIDVKVCGRKFWFIAHMSCMYCSVLLAWVGLIMMIVSRLNRDKLLFPLSEELQNHGYVGFAACVIMLFQSTLIWWNPSFRKTLALMHSLCGIATFYMGGYCIAFSNKDTHHGAAKILYYGLAWIGCYVLFFIGMTIFQLCSDQTESPDQLASDPYRALKIPMRILSLDEAPNQILKLIILGIFVIVSLLLTILAINEIFKSSYV